MTNVLDCLRERIDEFQPGNISQQSTAIGDICQWVNNRHTIEDQLLKDIPDMGNITEVQGVIKRNDEEKKLRLQLTKCPNLSDKLTFTVPRHAIKFLESVK